MTDRQFDHNGFSSIHDRPHDVTPQYRRVPFRSTPRWTLADDASITGAFIVVGIIMISSLIGAVVVIGLFIAGVI